MSMKIRINSDDYSLGKNGELLFEKNVQLTAKEIDLIAGASALAAQANALALKISKTSHNGHEVVIEEDGDVAVGCQNVDAKLVQRVHKLSLAIRKRKGGKTAKK